MIDGACDSLLPRRHTSVSLVDGVSKEATGLGGKKTPEKERFSRKKKEREDKKERKKEREKERKKEKKKERKKESWIRSISGNRRSSTPVVKTKYGRF